jgi:ketosteroid isomerase-like protein
MSRENVELVRGMVDTPTVDMFETFGGGAPDGADFSMFADDVEVVFVGLEPGLVDGRYTGVNGLFEGWQDWLAPWSRYEATFEEFIDAGDNVVVLARLRGETKHGGVAVEHDAAAVWTIADGRVVRVAFHLDRRSALESVGRADLLA